MLTFLTGTMSIRSPADANGMCNARLDSLVTPSEVRPADPIVSAVRAFTSCGDLTYIAGAAPGLEQRILCRARWRAGPRTRKKTLEAIPIR